MVNAVSPVDPQNKRGNIAKCHDRLKQIPVSSAVYLLLTVLCNCDPAFYLGFSDSCFELVYTNRESVSCPEVIRCGLHDIKIQTLTNQKEALKRKRGPYTTLKTTEPLVSLLVLQFLCSVSHTS